MEIDNPVYEKCPACRYETHDIPSSTDDAHDELCCGMNDGCAWRNDPKELCITHDDPTDRQMRLAEQIELEEKAFANALREERHADEFGY